MKRIETQVLVIGSGPTGASAAVFLRRYGIDVLLVSRTNWLADSPRAHITNCRTMEIMRDVGLEESCMRSASPQAYMANNVWAMSLAGPELGRLLAWGNHPRRLADYQLASPSSMSDLPQTMFEPILINEAARTGAGVRFLNQLIDFEQDADGVTARVKDVALDEEYEVRALYMIAGDGGRSSVIQKLGLPLDGETGLGTAVNVLFQADLSRFVAHRPGSIYSIFQAELGEWGGAGQLRMVRPWNEWIAIFPGFAQGNQEVSIGDEQARDIVHKMIGDESVEVKVTGVAKWLINHVVASRYSKGRVFCAGDAVHRHPPMNGLGLNTCIQDSYNLAWKLAHVIKGSAGQALLETYSEERQPVGKRIVDRAIAGFEENKAQNAVLGLRPGQTASQRREVLESLSRPGLEAARRRAQWFEMIQKRNRTYNALGVELNQTYASTAVVGDGSAAPTFDSDPELYYQPSTWPGSRLPHCWLERGGLRLSTHDLAGKERFCLLTGIGGDDWIEAARSVSGELGVEVVVYRIGLQQDVLDPCNDWGMLREVEEDGCVLVRPDMHVGWRAREKPGNCREALHSALNRILAR